MHARVVLPVIHSLRSIDAMRAEAQSFIDRKTAKHARGEDTRYEREGQLQVERVIDLAIATRALSPACPFCKGGVMAPWHPGLMCIDCGARAQRGGLEALVHPLPDPALDSEENDADPT